MTRTLSFVVPSGRLTLGNLLGAVQRWTSEQLGSDSLYGVADLHVLTVQHDPAAVRAVTSEQIALLIAAGLDPDRAGHSPDVVRRKIARATTDSDREVGYDLLSCTDVVLAVLTPLQQRYAEIADDAPYLARVQRQGAELARDLGAPTLTRAKAAIGLVAG